MSQRVNLFLSRGLLVLFTAVFTIDLEYFSAYILTPHCCNRSGSHSTSRDSLPGGPDVRMEWKGTFCDAYCVKAWAIREHQLTLRGVPWSTLTTIHSRKTVWYYSQTLNNSYLFFTELIESDLYMNKAFISHKEGFPTDQCDQGFPMVGSHGLITGNQSTACLHSYTQTFPIGVVIGWRLLSTSVVIPRCSSILLL